MRYIILALLLLGACQVQDKEKDRREEAAKVWANFIDGDLRECAHPEYENKPSFCSVWTRDCKYYIKCDDSSCELETKECSAEQP